MIAWFVTVCVDVFCIDILLKQLMGYKIQYHRISRKITSVMMDERDMWKGCVVCLYNSSWYYIGPPKIYHSIGKPSVLAVLSSSTISTINTVLWWVN